MTAERLQQLLRDYLCVLLGLSIGVHQAFILPPGKASDGLLALAATLLAGPMLGGAISLRRDASPGAGSGSPSSPSPSSPPSSPPAPSGAGDPV